MSYLYDREKDRRPTKNEYNTGLVSRTRSEDEAKIMKHSTNNADVESMLRQQEAFLQQHGVSASEDDVANLILSMEDGDVQFQPSEVPWNDPNQESTLRDIRQPQKAPDLNGKKKHDKLKVAKAPARSYGSSSRSSRRGMPEDEEGGAAPMPSSRAVSRRSSHGVESRESSMVAAGAFHVPGEAAAASSSCPNERSMMDATPIAAEVVNNNPITDELREQLRSEMREEVRAELRNHLVDAQVTPLDAERQDMEEEPVSFSARDDKVPPPFWTGKKCRIAIVVGLIVVVAVVGALVGVMLASGDNGGGSSSAEQSGQPNNGGPETGTGVDTDPTAAPSANPTPFPPAGHTSGPTVSPSMGPTVSPSISPPPTRDGATRGPTAFPTTRPPTRRPTHRPTPRPTHNDPTYRPTSHPTHNDPTYEPTHRPTHIDTTYEPTHRPTHIDATYEPTHRPTHIDTTYKPTVAATNPPSKRQTPPPTNPPPTPPPTSPPPTPPPTEQEGCSSNGDCGGGEYCSFPSGECSGNGDCVEKPNRVCNNAFDPVCGCDGVTYSNSCWISNAGVSTKSDGEC